MSAQSFAGEAGQPPDHITVSGGVATFPLDAQDDLALIKAADARLYEAKEKGRNRTVGPESSGIMSRRRSRFSSWPLLAAAVAPGAGEIPDATLVLEAAVGVPGTLPAAAPPRFVLRRDGSVFVGGSEPIYAGLLDKDEVKAHRAPGQGAAQVGSLLGPSVSFGDDAIEAYRLRAAQGRAPATW